MKCGKSCIHSCILEKVNAADILLSLDFTVFDR